MIRSHVKYIRVSAAAVVALSTFCSATSLFMSLPDRDGLIKRSTNPIQCPGLHNRLNIPSRGHVAAIGSSIILTPESEMYKAVFNN